MLDKLHLSLTNIDFLSKCSFNSQWFTVLTISYHNYTIQWTTGYVTTLHLCLHTTGNEDKGDEETEAEVVSVSLNGLIL